MIEIKINGKKVQVQKKTSLDQLKNQKDISADIVIYNGFALKDLNIVLKENDEVFFIKRGRNPSKDMLKEVMMSRHTPGVYDNLQKASVGIAGVGGLGSHIAIALARIGVGNLVIVDFDVVEPSNLNRQMYQINQLGQKKVFAMKDNIQKINPYLNIAAIDKKIDNENIFSLFEDCSIVIEAFDRPDQKTMLIKSLSKTNKIIIGASGMAGYGQNDSIITRKINDKLYIIGDFTNEAKPGRGLMAPRVMIAAAKQANLAVELILDSDITHL